jgi:hypothetical protein
VPTVPAARLRAQRLVGPTFQSVADAVRWLTAVQSQDYTAAKWALGQRVAGVTDADIDRLYDEGAILRTHVLRPTWHFVLPEDIRWLLQLTGPKIHQGLAGRVPPARAGRARDRQGPQGLRGRAGGRP